MDVCLLLKPEVRFCKEYSEILKGPESTINLVPGYVGWYMVEFYRVTAKALLSNKMRCSTHDLRWS